jgi:hypothetical protein
MHYNEDERNRINRKRGALRPWEAKGELELLAMKRLSGLADRIADLYIDPRKSSYPSTLGEVPDEASLFI